MAEDDPGDGEAPPPPRQTYMPKPPSKEEVDQVSREQGMISDEWTGEPSAGESGESPGGTEGNPPAGKGRGG